MISQTSSSMSTVTVLGKLISEHKDTRSRSFRLIGGIIFIGLGLVTIAAGGLGIFSYLRASIVTALSIGGVPLILGIAFVVIGLNFLRRWLTWDSSISAALFENGFAYLDRGGLTAAKWEEVETIRFKATHNSHAEVGKEKLITFFVHLKTGQTITLLPQIKNVESLGKAISQNLQKILEPQYEQMLLSGQKIAFGDFALDKEHLYYKDKSLEWKEIDTIDFHNDQTLYVVKKGSPVIAWAKAKISQIPNSFLFTIFTRRLTLPRSEFSSVTNFGALLQDYTPSIATRRSPLIQGAFGIAVGVILILLGIFFNSYGRDGQFINCILSIFAFVFIVASLLKLNDARKGWQLAAALYENGFVVKIKNTLTQVSWTDIIAVWHKITVRTRGAVPTRIEIRYAIQFANQQWVYLDESLPRVTEMGDAIVSISTKFLTPRYLQALQMGQRIPFGDLQLDQQGIYYRKQSLEWYLIEKVRVTRYAVQIYRDNSKVWASLNPTDMPNVFCFIELINRFNKLESVDF